MSPREGRGKPDSIVSAHSQPAVLQIAERSYRFSARSLSWSKHPLFLPLFPKWHDVRIWPTHMHPHSTQHTHIFINWGVLQRQNDHENLFHFPSLSSLSFWTSIPLQEG